VVNERVVYLLRHGRTVLNADGMLRGHSDVPLDAAGLLEASQLGKLFARVPLEVVVTSPLRRARATAEEVASATSLQMVVDARLVDRDYGPWTGMPENDVRARAGGLDTAPGVEVASAVKKRVLAALDDALDLGNGGPIALVAHDAVNRLLLAELVPGLGPSEQLPQPTGCWNLLKRVALGWEAPVVGAVPGDGRTPGAT
jgi:broad specificity phosphatase PhoE